MSTRKTRKPRPEPTRSREPLKRAWLAFAAIWIITIDCILVNLFVLKTPALMYSAIPIVLIIIFAHVRVSAAQKGAAPEPGPQDNG